MIFRFNGLGDPLKFIAISLSLALTFWISGCSTRPEASFSLQSEAELPAGTPITINLPEELDAMWKAYATEPEISWLGR